MKITRIEAGHYEGRVNGHTWTIERWAMDERLWIGYCLELHDVSTDPLQTKWMVLRMIENGIVA